MMRNFLKMIGMAAIAASSPALAQSSDAPEWWLVLNQSDSQSAHFVDLASMTRFAQLVQVSALIVDRNGNGETKSMTVDCSGMEDGEQSIRNFVCGNEEYRSENGLLLGMASPDEVAEMLLAAQSGNSTFRGFQEA